MMRQQPYFCLFGRLVLHWQPLSLALYAMLIIATASAFLPILIQQLLHSTFLQQDLSRIQMISLAIIILFIARGMASYISISSIHKASCQLGIDLRMEIFNKLLTLPVSHYAHLSHHDIDKLISRINRITHSIARNIRILAQDCLTIIGLIICIFYLNREFSLLLLFIAPLLILIIQVTHDYLNTFDQRNSSASNSLVQHLLQSIKQYREIRLHGGQNHENERLGKTAESIYQAEIQQASIKAAVIPISEVVATMILVAVFYFISQQVLNDLLSLDTVGAFIAAVLLLINPIQRIAGLPKQLQHEQKNIEIVLSFIQQASGQDTGTQSIAHVHGKLTFEHVRFGNNAFTKPILNHINFTIKPGEIIVFTGYTEDEKNAFIDLILCLQQPTSGRILFDDHSLSDIQLNDLHANIAMITYDSVLLDEIIAGNIAYGTMRCANEAKITAAAQASHAMEFIREMSEGLQTWIGNDGANVTQQQRQQIAIARALLKNSPILILDEIPAADEPDSDNLLLDLEKLMQNRTTLIFNQQIPHLKKIDRIVVLENGCITESLTNIR
ncbi:ATP-binding cassette, subfamily B, MsbA [Nitrosomonas sp. Nm84]|nr:ATP-binding cassette, subfamily B, MsbA [Nitrosomonas sp. Nm84]